MNLPKFLPKTVACASVFLASNLSAALDTSVSASESGPSVTGYLLDSPKVASRYDFDSNALSDNGLLRDGWVDLIGVSFPSIQVFNNAAFGGGRGTGGGANGSGNQDSSHPSVVIASPPFELVPNMAVSFGIAGGTGTAAVPANLSTVPASSSTSGFQGVGLRRISDNAYLLTARRSGNSTAYETKVWNVATLDAIRTANPGERFSIDWIDYFHGSWGFAGVDDVVFAIGGTPVAPFKPQVLALSNPINLAGSPGFGGTLAGTLSDTFAYNPYSPTSVLPDQIFNGADGYHNNNTNTDAIILYDVTPTTVDAGTAIVVDLWTRSDCCQNRDNNVDVAFLDAANNVLGEVTGLNVPDAAPQFIRASTSGVVANAAIVAKIRVTGHDSDEMPATTNSFTLMEIRAAKITPTITLVNGAANNGSPIVLTSGATVTVNPNGEFDYNPVGAGFVAPASDTFTVTSGFGSVVSDTGTVTVNITGPNATVYVDDDFASLTVGDPITDADLGASGNQGATFGTDAFASIGEGIGWAAPGATIVVNSGDYSERVALSDRRSLSITGVDVAGNVSVTSISVASQSVISVQGGSVFDVGDSKVAEGSIVLNNTSTLVIDSGAIEVAVTGSGSIVKNSVGELYFSAANTYAGGTTINGGRVRFLASGNLGSGSVVVNSGGQVFMTNSLTNDFAIQGTGWTEAAGELGAIRFNNTTLTGNLTIDAAGARVVGYGGAAGQINGDLLGTGNLEVNFTANTLANGTVSLLGSGTSYLQNVTVSRGRFNMGSSLGGSVVVEDGAILGGEGVINGDLQLGSTGGTGGTIIVDPLTSTALSANNLTVEGVTTASILGLIPGGVPIPLVIYSGTLLDANGGDLNDSFTISGGGALRSAQITDNLKTIEVSGAPESSVWTANVSDTWQPGLAESNWTSSDGLFYTGDSVTFDDTVNATFSGTVTAAGNPVPGSTTFNNSSQDYTVSGGIAGMGGLTKDGTGTVNLASQSTFTGGTTVNDGLLNLTGGGGVNGTIRGEVTVNTGGILRFSSGDVTGYGNSTASLQTINISGGEVNVAVTTNQTLGGAAINMTGGSLTGIVGSNLDFFQGPSTINVLASADASVIGGTRISLRQNNGLTITVADGAALNDLVINSVITNAAGFANNNLRKAGGGVMLLNAANGFNTAAFVDAGTLGGDGSINAPITVASGATLAPGTTVGTFTVNNAATLAVGSTLKIDVDGVAADLLAVSGVLDVTGATIDFSVISAPTEAVYLIASGSSIVGTPTTADEPAGYSLSISATEITLVSDTATGYDLWAYSNGLTSANNGISDNPDSDSLVNLLEFAFGTNPNLNDATMLSVTDGASFTPGTQIVEISTPFTPGNIKALYVQHKDPSAAGLTYVPQFSADLSNWETYASPVTPTVVSTQAGDYEVVEVPYMVFLSNGQKASFCRILVNSTGSGGIQP